MPRQRSPSNILAVPYHDMFKAPISPTHSNSDSAYATTSKSPKIWFKPPNYSSNTEESEDSSNSAPLNRPFDKPLPALRAPIRELIDDIFPVCNSEDEYGDGEGRDGSERIIKTVEIQGGSSNRIIRLQFFNSSDAISNDQPSRTNSSKRPPKVLILRLPRYTALHPEQTSHHATHTLLSSILPNKLVPLSKILQFDPTSDNLLKTPYTIQTFMPGKQLIHLLKTDSIPQSGILSIASQLASVYAACNRFRTSLPGKIDLATASTNTTPLIIQDALKLEEQTFPTLALYSYWPWYSRSLRLPAPSSTNPLASLHHRLIYFSQALSQTPNSLSCAPVSYAHRTYTTLSYILSTIEANSQIFSHSYNVLVHGDLLPHNILVDEVDGQWKITTILDWDTAHFSVPVALFKPPTFLWRSMTDGTYKDHRIWADESALPPLVPRRPSSSPSRSSPLASISTRRLEVRRHFEKEMTSTQGLTEYPEMAYSPWAKLARRILELCQEGLVSEEGWCAVYDVYEMFLQICEEEGVDDEGVVRLGEKERKHWREMKRRADEAENEC